MIRLHQTASWILALLVALVVLYTVCLSLGNPIRADLAMLHYSGYLMQEKGFLLYRDILEINFPAPFLLHQWLGSVLGYEALPLRWLDFATMAGMAWLSWRILQPLSPASAVVAPGLFALFYLVNGAEYTLERDYLVILPCAAAFLCATSARLALSAGSLLIGCLCGIACSIKPNAIVAAPALFAVFWLQTPALRQWPAFLKTALLASVVFLATVSLPFVVIGQQGVLDDFIQLYKTFLPIYTNTRYDLFHYASRAEYWSTLGKNYLYYTGMSALLVMPGIVWAYLNTDARLRITQLAIMAFGFSLYELIAGKFWVSHMMPSAYWTLLGFSLLLVPPRNTPTRTGIAIVCLLIVGSFCIALASLSVRHMQAYVTAQTEGRVRATNVAAYLKHHLKEGDTVQTLDVAGDGQACLLESRATAATRFLIDVPLYLQPDSTATQALRKEFLQALVAKPPAFIVYFEVFLHPGGGNRLREFGELYAFIESHYVADVVQDGEYTIYRLK